ncbi:DUF2254 family protein [Kitasatospora sp. NPDC094015]|uniref:DUF2254 family protein n=1 Tax=Kitasatospora sp. NPDC094015 TaxID=3155205 RepID=UPI00332399D5
MRAARVRPTHALPARRRRLRAGLAQLLGALAGFGLGLLVPRATAGPTVPARPTAELLLGLGLGVLGAVTVVFSLLFLVLQWAATTFTPRLTLFRDAPIVWRTFAFSVGLAVFGVTAAMAIGNRTDVSVVVPAVTLLLLLAMLVLLRTLQLKAFAAIQLAPVLDSVAVRGRAVLATLYAAPPPEPSDPAAGPERWSTVRWPGPPVALQQVDADRLVAAARAAGGVLVLRALPGATLRRGAPVADLRGAAGAGPPDTAGLDAAVLAGLRTGQERTFDQDPLLAFRLLADIALRALSPAVNDPATAVQALEDLEDLLGLAVHGPARVLRFTDAERALRLVVPLPTAEEFLRTGLDEVIVAAARSPMVLDRLRALLRRLAAAADPALTALLAPRSARVAAQQARLPAVGDPDGPASPAAGEAGG